MSTTLKWTLVVIALVLSIIWAENRFAAKHGADNALLNQVTHQTDSTKKVSVKRDTVFVHDTLRLAKSVRVYRTLRDTLVITDTVAVEKTLAAADTALAQCDSVVKDATQSILTHRAIEEGLERENALIKKSIPSRTERFIHAAKWLTIGAVVGLAVAHR